MRRIFDLPRLPYPYDALEPMCDAKTMEIHHLRCYIGYVDRINEAMREWIRQSQGVTSLDVLIENIDSYDEMAEDLKSRISFYGGGFNNHHFFWLCLAPFTSDKNIMSSKVANFLTLSFGNVEIFKDEFRTAALKHQGNGWCWLVGRKKNASDDKCKLEIITTENNKLPFAECGERRTLLCLDLWEHAYFLKFQDRRDVYIDAFWNVVNWQFVERRYDRLITGEVC
jgi:Fe-Mn family superoxide dismutase